MRILVIEPGKQPYLADIPNTLHAKQQIVGGLIDIQGAVFMALGVEYYRAER